MEDQILHQFKRQENLKKTIYEESAKTTFAPKIDDKSRIIAERKMEEDGINASPVHKRLFYAQPSRPEVSMMALQPLEDDEEGSPGMPSARKMKLASYAS